MLTVEITAQEEDVDPLDLYIGARLRQKRTSLNIGRRQLAAMSGITRDKITDYEKGLKCIDTRSLYILADCLETTVGYFYEKAESLLSSKNVANRKSNLQEIIADMLPNISFKDIYLLQIYNRIQNPEKKMLIYDVVDAFSED
jgi:transcriptional regulator with XRE-family HTH domain